MPKVCIKAPEIVMSGDVGLNAQFNVSTKAKIDSVSVAGGCECPDVPKEKEFNFADLTSWLISSQKNIELI